MSDYGDSFEIIIDGQSGLLPSGGPFALIVGPCSQGVVGKKYLFGKDSNISVLGKGKLVDRFKDVLSRCKSDTVFVVVPSLPDVVGTKSMITHQGTGKATYNIQGSPIYDADVIIEILSSGGLNSATARISLDGGDSWGSPFTIPLTGEVFIEDTGVKIIFESATNPDESFVMGDRYSFKITGASSSLSKIMEAINIGLETYSPEWVYVAQETNDTMWSAFGVKADELYEEHRPTLFLTETHAKQDSKTIDEYVDELVAIRRTFSHRWVHVCASYGEILDGSGRKISRNVSGLVLGDISRANVNESIGKVKKFYISNVTLPEDWSSTHSKTLCDAGYIVLRNYPMKANLYWARGKSLADDTSDFRYIEVSRTVFKAIRIIRQKCLEYMQENFDESMLNIFKAELENALSKMTTTIPPELDHFVVNIPSGQDVVNNGLVIDYELYGIPVIGKFINQFRYKYANPTA